MRPAGSAVTRIATAAHKAGAPLSARALAGPGGPLGGLCRINQSTLAPVQHCFVDQMPRPHSGKTPYTGQLFRRSGHVLAECGGSFDVVSLSRVSVFVSVAVSMTDLFGHLGRSYAGPETTGRPRSACGPADQVDIVPGSEGPREEPVTMQRRHLRRIVIAGVSVLMIGSMGFFTAGISHAAPDDTTFTQTEARQGGATPAYTGAGADANDVTKDADRLTTSTPADANQGSFLNAAIPGAALTAVGGRYRTMTNFWNTDMSWSCPQLRTQFGATSTAAANCTNLAGDADLTTKNLTMTLDSQAPEFKITNFTGNTYFAAGRTGVTNAQDQGGTCLNAAVVDRCHWTPNNAHFPSSYPASYKGCNFGQCSFELTNAGAVAASAGLPTP